VRFCSPAQNPTFSILDVDFRLTVDSTDYCDVVRVALQMGRRRWHSTLAKGAPASGSWTSAAPWLGTALVPDTDSGSPNPGCVTVCSNRLVTTVAVDHTRGSTTGATGGSPLFGGQHIGISDLPWRAT